MPCQHGWYQSCDGKTQCNEQGSLFAVTDVPSIIPIHSSHTVWNALRVLGQEYCCKPVVKCKSKSLVETDQTIPGTAVPCVLSKTLSKPKNLFLMVNPKWLWQKVYLKKVQIRNNFIHFIYQCQCADPPCCVNSKTMCFLTERAMKAF